MVEEAVVAKKLVVVPAVSESVPEESAPREASCEKRFVLLAVVEKRLVVVALTSVVSPVTVRVPLSSVEPFTANTALGEVVPIPTLPLALMSKAVEVA